MDRVDCERTMEKLARGETIEESTLVSEAYSNYVMKMFEETGCLKNDVLHFERLKKALEEELIDVDVFNKALWGQVEFLDF